MKRTTMLDRQAYESAVPGIVIAKAGAYRAAQWRLFHQASGLLIADRYNVFARRDAAFAASEKVAALELPIDFTLDTESLRKSPEFLTAAGKIAPAITPPEVLEEKRLRAEAAVRYIRAIEADGFAVDHTESLGIMGTQYHMTCGCVRTYGVSGGIAGDYREHEYLVPCERHEHLLA